MKFFKNLFWKIKNEINILNRCCRYARRLNKINHTLEEYWQKKNLSIDALNLIDEIDRILDSK